MMQETLDVKTETVAIFFKSRFGGRVNNLSPFLADFLQIPAGFVFMEPKCQKIVIVSPFGSCKKVGFDLSIHA